MLATLTAGALALGAHRLATLSGRIGEAILISTFVFIMGTKLLAISQTMHNCFLYIQLIMIMNFNLDLVQPQL